MRRAIVSWSGSLAINGLFVLLIILPSIVYEVEVETIEIPVEITAAPPEPPPPAPTPPPEAQQPLAAGPPPATAESVRQPPVSEKSAGQHPSGFDARDIADEERQQKAEQGKVTQPGEGTVETATAAPSAQKLDSEELDKDPHKEISHLVPPREKDRPKKKRIAPPGPEGKATKKEQPKNETADESTVKRQPLQCGANARRPVPAVALLRQGQVLGQLTRDQALRMIQMTQANLDMHISPAYVDNVRVMVHVDGTGPNAWVVVLLPRGMSVQPGDHIEYIFAHLDPARPCHYIPNLASRRL